MHHPDLEKQLKDLHKLKKEAASKLRDLATEAIENADRANKTMMMYLEPAGTTDSCVCAGQFCHCVDTAKPKTSRLFKNIKKALDSKSKEHVENNGH